MKKMILAAAMMLAVFACGKQENPGKPGTDDPETKEQTFPADFTGTVTVEYNGDSFDNPDIKVMVRRSETEGAVEIDIFQIRFVPAMPVTIDMTIPAISFTEQPDGSLAFSADGIDPLYLGKPVEKYRVTEFTGKLDDEGLAFSLNFGSFPTSFVSVGL